MSGRVVAIDPGPTKSALVYWDGEKVALKLIAPNEEVLGVVRGFRRMDPPPPLCIEMIASYGMAVGASVFETCVMIGRFMQEYGNPELVTRFTRNEVKNHICHSSKAKDANIRQAIIDRFGGKERAIGRKKEPGPLFGIVDDLWAATAVMLTYLDCGGKQKAA